MCESTSPCPACRSTAPPRRYWRSSRLEACRRTTGTAVSSIRPSRSPVSGVDDTILLKNDTCYACAVRCKRVVEVKELGVEGRYGGPEYENLATLGSYCMVSDLDRMALANQICNQEGMDPIAVGATIGWAMDAFAKGEITLADTGGMPILWGDAESMVKLTEMIATREGFGDVLAEGMNGASRK